MQTALLSPKTLPHHNNISSIKSSNVVLEEWTAGDEHSPIYWDFAGSPHGELLIASTSKGIAYVGRTEDSAGTKEAMEMFKQRFPNNVLLQERTPWHELAVQRIKGWGRTLPIHLHLRNKSQQLLDFCFGKSDHVRQFKSCISL